MPELEVLDRVLACAALASDVFFAGQPCGEWRMSSPDSAGSGAAFHLVLQGSPWMHFPHPSGPPLRLQPGDFVFLPRDRAHVLANSAAAPASAGTSLGTVQPVGTSDGEAALVCGKLFLERHAQKFLLAPLPEVIVMPGDGDEVPGIVPSIVSIMWAEVRGKERPLSTTLNRLADVLVAQVLRFAVRKGLVSSGAFAGLADPQLARALAAVIAAPEQAWSVDSLARQASMSRSAFASRFLSVVGTTPLDFVREWRMQQSVALLRGGRSVAGVAHSMGYESEASFAKAFKRVIGVGPGAVRGRGPVRSSPAG